MSLGKYKTWGEYAEAFKAACDRSVADGAKVMAETVRDVHASDEDRRNLSIIYGIMAHNTGRMVDDYAPDSKTAWTISPDQLFGMIARDISHSKTPERKADIEKQAAAIVMAREILKYEAHA